jgi:hypothetical protein
MAMMLSRFDVADVVMSWKCSVPEALGLAGLALAAVSPATAAVAAVILPSGRDDHRSCACSSWWPGKDWRDADAQASAWLFTQACKAYASPNHKGAGKDFTSYDQGVSMVSWRSSGAPAWSAQS